MLQSITGTRGSNMGTKLVVISIDAMITEDLQNAKQYPHFQRFLENAAVVTEVRSIYPTLTYPCHTTMLTGVYPDRHGVTENEQFLPGVLPLPWNFDHGCVRCPDLMDLCKAHGLTTACVGWPVTGNHPSVDYLIDEIWTTGRPWTKETMREELLHAGTSEELFEAVVRPLQDLRVPRRQPASSFFNIESGCAILRKYRPDVLLIHTGNMDHYRHEQGVFGEKTVAAAAENDEMLGKILAALEECGDVKNCNVVITSDHGQMDCTRSVNPNVLFVKHGLIRIAEDGSIKDWRAWSLSAGMSAHIYLKDPSDGMLRAEVYTLLKQLCEEGVWGFSEVFTEEETAGRDRLGGAFSFVLETDNYTSFTNAWTGPYVVPASLTNVSNRKGNHGFHPDKGTRPVFLGNGPAFRRGLYAVKADLVDEAPTLAAVLGLSMPDTDGRVLVEMLQ